jgi:tetratricopeptide (TPR) repeat protein
VRKIVKEAASDIAKRYENGNPDDEAAKIFEDIGLLGEAYQHYLKAGNLYKAAKIAKELGRVEEAKKHALQYIEEEMKSRRSIEPEKFYINLATEAKEFDLPDKVVELISKGVEEALGVEPEYALRLMEEEERKKGMKISEKVRRKVYAEVAKKYEREGKFELAAAFSGEAGLKEQAEVYEKVLRIKIGL